MSASALTAGFVKLTSRDRQREETRNRLLDTALAEFRRVGFAEAQVDDIVRAAGVACGTFYFHFPTKGDVLVELQRRSQENIVRRLAALPRCPISVKAFAQHLIEALVAESELGGHPDLRREIFALYARQPAALRGQDNNPLAEVVIRFFREAQKRGDVRADLMPAELMMMFLTSVFGVLVSRDAAGPELRSPLKRLVEVFVRGVAP